MKPQPNPKYAKNSSCPSESSRRGVRPPSSVLLVVAVLGEVAAMAMLLARSQGLSQAVVNNVMQC